MSETGKVIQQLGEIELEIENLKDQPRMPFNVDEMIEFNEKEMFQALLRKVKVRSDELHREEYLILQEGRLAISSAKFDKLDFWSLIPPHAGTFQLNGKLYVGGGELRRKELQFYQNFFSLATDLTRSDLHPMGHHREDLSLSGVSSQLVAIGGRSRSVKRKEPVGICESYSIRANKWS